MKTNRNELVRRLLSGVTDDELENLVRLREEARRPIPAPRKMGVKQLIRYFENNNLYKPPRPKKKRSRPQPIPAPRTKITEKSKALKGCRKSYEIAIKNDKDILEQLQNTRLAISRFFEKILNQNKGFKFVETIVVNFEKLKNGEPEEEMVYFNSKAQIIMNISDIKPNLEMSQEKIMSDVAEWLKEGSSWTTDGVLEHYFNLVNCKPLEGKSYIPLPKELQNTLKGLINLKNEDNECFRWCHIRYLNPQEVRPERIKRTDKKIVQELNYQGVDFPVVSKDYNKIEEQNNINIYVFGYENKQFYLIYVSKQKNEDLSGAKNTFEKDFFKLMNNSVYGKTCQNLRKRVDVRLVTDQNKLFKLASKPTYVNSKIFTEDLVAVHKVKETLNLDRPAYVGMCILDLSKTLMYDFLYNTLKRDTLTRLNYYLQIQTAFVMK